MIETLALSAAAVAALAAVVPSARQRIELSRAKHRSLAGHSRMAKRVARLVPGYAYDEAQFFGSDGAPADVVKRRSEGFARLVGHLNARHEKSISLTKQAREGISDLQFTGAYRVPYPYSTYLRERL